VSAGQEEPATDDVSVAIDDGRASAAARAMNPPRECPTRYTGAATKGVDDREDVGGVRVQPQVVVLPAAHERGLEVAARVVCDRPESLRRQDRQQANVVLLGAGEPRHEEHDRSGRRCQRLSGERGEAATRGADADGPNTVCRLITALVA
jgi:hypothetical protein